MPVYKQDDASGQLINLEFSNSRPVIVNSQTFMGVTPEMMRWYDSNICEYVKKIDKALEMTMLEPLSDGIRIVHQRIYTPVIVSNRSIIQTFYDVERTDGGFTGLASSQGNAELEKKYAKLIGSDVIAQAFIVYMDVTPIIGSDGKITGSRIVQVFIIDVGGSLPDMIRKKIGEAQTADL